LPSHLIATQTNSDKYFWNLPIEKDVFARLGKVILIGFGNPEIKRLNFHAYPAN